MKVAVDLKLFDHIAEAKKDGRSITADELAERSGAENLLIGKWCIPADQVV